MYFGYEIKSFGDSGFQCYAYNKGQWYHCFLEPTDGADACLTIYNKVYAGDNPEETQSHWDIIFQSKNYGLSEKWLKVGLNHFMNKEELDKLPNERIAFITNDDGTVKSVRGCKDDNC